MLAAISTELGQGVLALLIAATTAWLHHKTEQVHVMVNSRLTEALDRIAVLEHALKIAPGDPPPHA